MARCRSCSSRSVAVAAALFVAGLAPLMAFAFDLQGHRGARGLAPENTITGFKAALAVGVTTLETDLGMTRDGVLVLSHDPLLNPALTRDAAGRWLVAPGPAILALSRQELSAYDVGRLNPSIPYASQWPEQVASDGEKIPTLAQLFASAREARTPGGRPVRFNIETKLTPGGRAESPDPQVFATAVLAAIWEHGMVDRVTVQSFDWRSLVAIRRIAPALPTACLTIETDTTNTVRPDASGASPWHAGLKPADHGGSIVRLSKAAGCTTWSPFWRNVSRALVEEAHGLGLRVVPWTVNGEADMNRVIDLGVDGLITDYPDRAARVLAARGKSID